MPAPIGGIYASLTADLSGWSRGFSDADRVVATTSAKIRKELGLTDRTIKSVGSSMGGRKWHTAGFLSASRSFETLNDRANLLRATILATTSVVGGLVAAFSTNLILRYADSYTDLQNSLRVVSSSMADLASKQEALEQIADRSRAGLRETTALYSRLQKSLPQEAPERLMRAVETIQKALQLGGATAQESASAAIQFSQALASNRLQGEEIRAVLETPLGLELAKGLGVTIGRFREMGTEGKLTADVLLDALGKVSGSVDAAFARSIPNTERALTALDNALLVSIGEMDKATGGSYALVKAIYALADSIDTLLPILLASGAAIGLAFGGSIAGRGINRLSKSYRTLRENRLADLRLAVEQVAVMKEQARQAQIAVARAGKSAGDPLGAAPRSMVSEAQRARETLNKLDEKAIDLRQQWMAVVSQAGKLELQESARARQLRLAQQNAIDRLNQSMAEQARIQGQLAKLRTAQTLRAGGSTLTGLDMSAAKDEAKQFDRLQRDLSQSAAREQRIREDIRQRDLSMQQQMTQAQYRLFQQRLALSEQANRLETQIKATDKDIGAARTKAGIAQATALAAGQIAVADASAVAAKNLGRANAALSAQTKLMGAASRAATTLGVAMGFVSQGAGGLMAALGGPWGVAITAVIAALGVMGSKAAAAAQRTQEAEEIIRESLEKIAQAGGQAGKAAEKSLDMLRMEELQRQIATVNEEIAAEFERIGQAMTKAIALGSFGGIAESRFQALAILILRWRELSAALADGQISANDMKKELLELATKMKLPTEIINQIHQVGFRADNAAKSTELLGKEIDKIKGEHTITINVKTVLDKAWHEIQGFFAEQRISAGFEAAAPGIAIGEALGAESGLSDDMKEVGKLMEELKIDEHAALDMVIARNETENEIAAAKEAQSEATKSANDAERERLRLVEAIADIEREARISGFSEIDKQVIQSMSNLEAAKGMVEEYIRAVEKGNLSAAPQQLLDVRDALERTAAHNELPAIIEQYGDASQKAELFAEKQRMLNILVEEGQITAHQASQAYQEYVMSISDLEWISDIADQFSDFAESAIDDFDSIKESFADMVREMGKIALRELALKPFESAIKNILFSISGVGSAAAGMGPLSSATAGLLSGGTGGLYHEGGIPGKTKVPQRYVSDWRGSRRLAAGLLPNEMRAVLHKSEAVLNERMQGRINSSLSGLTALAKRSDREKIQIEVLPSELFEVRVRQTSQGEIAAYDAGFMPHRATRAMHEAQRRAVR